MHILRHIGNGHQCGVGIDSQSAVAAAEGLPVVTGVEENVLVGGSTSDMCALGSGENQVLYSFQEDYPSDYSLSMVSYNIGTAHTISRSGRELRWRE